MIKKIGIATALVALLSMAAFPEPRSIDIISASDLSTSGGKSVTANIAAVSGKRIAIWAINATSDKSGSVVTLAQANATGVTGNYTNKATFGVGAAAVTLGNATVPLYCGSTSYALRLTLDSTTKNNFIVNYSYE